MKLGFIGLGKMGSQMVARLIKAGHQVVVNDHNPVAVEQSVALGAIGSTDKQQLIEQLATPCILWLMIPAEFVDAEIDALLPLLSPGSILIDGGNSDYRLTKERSVRCAAKQVQLIDVGTSGGILGVMQGFAMMVGGDKAAYETITPILEALAFPDGFRHFGPSGAGHYIKMVHNAIEYGAMEAYAEGYHLLHDGQEYPGLDLAEIGHVWQRGSIIASTLNDLTQKSLVQNPELSGIDGVVAESGEARWTLESAQAQKIAMPAIAAALQVRLDSQQGTTHFGTKLLAVMRNAFGGHAINKVEK